MARSEKTAAAASIIGEDVFRHLRSLVAAEPFLISCAVLSCVSGDDALAYHALLKAAGASAAQTVAKKDVREFHKLLE